MSIDIQSYFTENKYVIIKQFLSTEMCQLLYNYCKLKAQREDYRSTFFKETYHPKWEGKFNDTQAPGAYAMYGDPLMDGLLELSKPLMESFTGLPLLHQYSYWRLYQKGNVLERHRDRESCEISTTLCLGYDISDVDQSVYPDYNWPMWVQSKDGSEVPVHMKPGDMIVYRGCEIDHWRDKFIGKNHAQVFMHYNNAAGSLANDTFDTRHILGIPKF